MQAVQPVDVQIAKKWRDGSAKRSSSTRLPVKVKTINGKKSQTVQTNQPNPSKNLCSTTALNRARSQSPPTRDPWVPAPGRSSKGQKLVWQSPKARLEIVQSPEDLVNDQVEEEETSFDRPEPELKLKAQNDSSRIPAERLEEKLDSTKSGRIIEENSFLNAARPSRSTSADGIRTDRIQSRVSFHDEPFPERRRARSTTPMRKPINLDVDREKLLIALANSESDIAQITKQLSAVKDILIHLRLDNQPISLEIEQLTQQRNRLLDSIEQFEYSNRNLKQFIKEQYHIEAERAALNEKTDVLLKDFERIENENQEIRRLLLDRENDNISLQSELERIRTQTIGFDTMKTSLEQNRAHLQRELYAKEGEINRLQCSLRSLEKDLQRSRSQCENIQRAVRRTPMFPKSKGMTIEKLQLELEHRDRLIEQLERQLYASPNERLVDANTELTKLRTKLEHAERLVNEYKEQLHVQSLKTSVNNSKTHHSEIEFEKIRIRLQKRLEELEPLPELLRQAELKNSDLQSRLLDQEKRISEQNNIINELNSKANAQFRVIDRMKENQFCVDGDQRTLQIQLDSIQRQLLAAEDENANLLRNLNAKDEALRNTQTRLNSKTNELSNLNKQFDAAQTDLKAREETYTTKERFHQQRNTDLEQQLSRMRQEFTQLKREKDELERRYTSQLGELRDKLEQSNNNNRSMQNYVNSLKMTYASVFNDPLPLPTSNSSTGTFGRFSSTNPSMYP